MSWYKALNLLFFVLNAALFVVAIFFGLSRGYVQGSGFTQYEVITLVLASIAVLLTALGIFLAIIAVWGYSTLRQAAIDHAGKVAETVAARVAQKVADRNTTRPAPDDYGAAAGREGQNENIENPSSGGDHRPVS